MDNPTTFKGHKLRMEMVVSETGLKSTIYGSRELTSIIAGFESDIITLQNSREHYMPNSKAFLKQQDNARLKAVSEIESYSQGVKNDLLNKLKAIKQEAYADIFDTYDYNIIAERVLELLVEYEEKENGKG